MLSTKVFFSTLLVKTHSVLNSPGGICKMSLIQLITPLFIQRQRLLNQQDLACFLLDNFLCILISVPRICTELLEKKRFLLHAKVENSCEDLKHPFPQNSLSFAINGNYKLYIGDIYVESNYGIFLSYHLAGKKDVMVFF